MQVRAPASPTDFEKYYRLRWEVLRAPWQQPIGSERAADDVTATHLMLLNEKEEALGVCRLHLATPEEAQIRFMAIHPDYQGQGLGQKLLAQAEEKAQAAGATIITLQARENAVKFYQKCGYQLLEKTHLLFDEIQHYKMCKSLENKGA